MRIDRIVPIAYFSILILFSSKHLLSFDTYYYWEWSRHLALSYFDGAPMIAYFIKLATLAFGDTLFALNAVGIVTLGLTSFILFKTARLFLNQESSLIASALWLFSPLVNIDILKQTTYDTPLVLFWSLTLYFAMKWIVQKQTKDFYLASVSVGLMLLSKYSGIVLVIPLLIFLTTPNYRQCYKTPHFYYSLLIPILLFSPVIIWNIQHHWQSFSYQLTTHELHNTENPVYNSLKSFVLIFIPALNFMLLPSIFCWIEQKRYILQTNKNKQSDCVRLCRFIGLCVIVFYLVLASHVEVKGNWLTPYLLTSALLGGYCFQMDYVRKLSLTLIALYAVSSLSIFFNSTFPVLFPKKFVYYHLVQNINQTFRKLPQTVITSGWLEARMLFFLKNKPNVYTINCGIQQNQYAFWSQDIMQKIKNKALKEVLYIDTQYRMGCLSKYFDQCMQIPIPGFTFKNQYYEIYAFRCLNQS